MIKGKNIIQNCNNIETKQNSYKKQIIFLELVNSANKVQQKVKNF